MIALVASGLRPGVGDEVTLWAAWDGPWPAEIAWEGVEREAGVAAIARALAPGEQVVRAGGATLALDVQPAANRGVVDVDAHAVPLYAVDADRCRDDRYPTLAGPWLVSCSSRGVVDRALHLGTREEVALVGGARAPGVGDGVLADATQGLWRLPSPEPSPLARSAGDPVGPLATDGEHVAVAWPTAVEAFESTATTRTRADARPVAGEAVALAWPLAAWVQQDPLSGEDVWVRGPDAKPRALARGPGSERLLAGDGRWLAWAGPGGVYVQDVVRGERRAYAADTGFLSAPTLWGPVACWEDRARLRAGTGDVDLRCSDGVTVARAGDQLHPARWGPWLVFREGGHVFLATASAVVLDDDDPRAEGAGDTVPGGFRDAHRDGGVRYTFAWPAAGWRVERWVDGAWVAGEPLAVGVVTVEHPGGDAVRVVPG
ncbi:MAG: hypothetical protein ACOZNI_13755 [Myxococcota bacterium]